MAIFFQVANGEKKIAKCLIHGKNEERFAIG